MTNPFHRLHYHSFHINTRYTIAGTPPWVGVKYENWDGKQEFGTAYIEFFINQSIRTCQEQVVKLAVL